MGIIRVTTATEEDYPFIVQRDKHVAPCLIMPKIISGEIRMLRTSDEHGSNTPSYPVGWLRFGYFWDNIPFLNMIWLDKPYRQRGFGKQAMQHWEKEMKQLGYNTVMTSTQADEQAQHFYRKMGYKDSGALLMDTQPLEIFLIKKI